MKILTAAEMREVDRRTIAAGIPGLILMENAAHRVVEALRQRYSPLHQHHIVLFCGKGNNGGDGLAIARILATVDRPRRLDVLLVPGDLPGDALTNRNMLQAAGVPTHSAIETPMRHATLLVDALLGTGANGPPRGLVQEWIHEINTGFPRAQVVAVDIPSGLDSDAAQTESAFARADLTVTFTAPKQAHALPPNCDRMGELVVAPIGTPDHLLDDIQLHWLTPHDFAPILAARPRDGHKGTFGHALIIGGAPGKTGAAHMAGLAALRAGAGRVTVACAPCALPAELMTTPLDEPDFAGKTVVAIGPGLGLDPRVPEWFASSPLPLVLDADALNTLAGAPFHGPSINGAPLRVLTPHPGEMARLSPAAQQPRLALARDFATHRNVVLVLKGQRTLIAFPDGAVYVNPTGTPALATAGSGDILTGLIAGLLAQHQQHSRQAVLAAVWLHGKAGELAAAQLGERCVIATDLLTLLPDALRHAN
jgi:ADP-dependent NAD(P)H-hydrate dehydratase / NAD(P)H-hydrate epimerase